MMKILLFLFFSLFFNNLFSQYSTEHWFAPMVDRIATGNTVQRLYLSTAEVTPFKVDIYNNNTVVGSVTISKNSPQFFNLNRSLIITQSQAELFTPIKKGIYLKGEKEFFASLRFSVAQHAEIITSKGNAAIGKHFRTAMAPISVNNSGLNFMTSFMAKEDNTSVTISQFNPTIRFSDGVSRTQFNFILNKGESYIIDGRGSLSENRNGAFIGAKVVADKPITITNGNFNGQYAGNYPSASDILMDQGVPEDRLGQKFILVKGNGANSFTDGGQKKTMEKAIIVAVEDNTQVYLNNSLTPVATLMEGDFFETFPDSYINQGSGHYNLFISSNKNIYVYQLLAGVENGNSTSNANGVATGGFNYIPPLSCYLPKKIDEIGMIDENRVFINSIGSYRDKIPTKLNIITEKFKSDGVTPSVIDVKINGVSKVLDASNGPFDVAGTNDWITYSVPGITGNVSVFSSSAVTAGISAGDDAVGYGGYFAGFSFIPLIDPIPENVCLPFFPLKISEGFDNYKWMFQDKDGNVSVVKNVSGTTPDANTITPTEIGYYWVEVQQGSCNPVVTDKKRVLNCGDTTSEAYDICNLLPPTQVKLSLDNVPITGIREDTKPKNGVLIIDNTAKTFSYIPDAGATDDEFTYEIVTADTSKNEKVKVTINIKSIATQDTIIKGCKIDATRGSFDLRKVSVADTSATKVFYKDQNNADNDTGLNTITTAEINSGAYIAPEGLVYLRLDNVTCKKTVKVDLKFYPVPDLVANTYLGCDEDYSGVKVKLDQVAAQLLTNVSDFPDIRFYLNSSATGTSLPNDWSYSAKTTVYMLVNSPDGCSSQTFPVTFDVGTRIPLLKTSENYTLCDLDLNGTEDKDLNVYNNLFLSPAQLADTDIKTYFYLTLEDAQTNRNRLPDGNVTISSDIIYHYRFEKAGVCSNVGSLSIKFTQGFASTTIQPTKTICDSSTTEINAGTAHDAFHWFSISDPSLVIPSTQKVNLGPGKYYVILTSPNLCEYKQNFEIIGSPKAILDISKLNATFCDDKLKGQIDVKFSTQVTPVILQNPHPDIKVEYYRDATFTQLINGDNFSYSTDTRVYVKAVSKYCTETRAFIDFKIGNKVLLSSIKQTQEVCDDDLDGRFKVSNLNDYIKLFTSDPNVSAKFYVKESDAKIEAANNITEIDVNNQQVLYVRFYNTTGSDCPNIGELTIKIKIPKKSDVLADKTICPDDKTDVEAALAFSDFQSYNWYSDDDPSTIIATGHIARDLPVGKYFVILTGNYPNDCPFRQDFEIKAGELPVIDGIEISGSTVRIIASGGAKPYRYAIDGGAYQDSNVFTDLDPGLHTAYVISADNCESVEKEFSVIKIYNLITPNGDGVNDVLDMSLLKLKINVKFQIFDREGKKLFEGNNNNNYIWDGRQNGKPLSSSSYWYVMEWQDFENAPPVKYTGWILLKNRNQ